MARSLRTVLPAGLLLLAGCAAPDETALNDLGPEVGVTGGIIRGSIDDGIKQYHGIPYAAPPIGELRWAPPAPVAVWEGVRDATSPGPACPQPGGAEGDFYQSALGRPQSEDCLTLNVWSEAAGDTEKRPVMVWVHGGALLNGTGADYSGAALAAKGVVVVTINYRLGPFGFLALPALSQEHPAGVSGNQGLRDQIAALEWVRDNIAGFGGDPDNVTIFGESAGSFSMSLLQASPRARGLFHRVIGQSGGMFQPMWFRAQATGYAPSAEMFNAAIAEAIAEEDGETSLAALRGRSTEEVMAGYLSDPRFFNMDAMAIVDGEIVPEEVDAIFAAGRQADVPVLIGWNADEGTTMLDYMAPAFGTGAEGLARFAATAMAEADGDELARLYPAGSEEQATASWEQLTGDVMFGYPMRAWARSMETVSSPAYLYWFTWQPPIPQQQRYRSFHGAEIAYAFTGNLGAFGATPTDADRDFAETVSDLWVRFAATGDPNGSGAVQWPAFTRDNEAYLELGPRIRPERDLRMAQMALIEKTWAARRSR